MSLLGFDSMPESSPEVVGVGPDTRSINFNNKEWIPFSEHSRLRFAHAALVQENERLKAELSRVKGERDHAIAAYDALYSGTLNKTGRIPT